MFSEMFGSLRWDGGRIFFIGLRGGGVKTTALEHPFIQTQWKIW